MKKDIITLLITYTIIITNLYSQNQIVAEVNGEKITLKDISSKLLISNFNQTLQELIEEKLLLQEAKKRNINIPSSELKQFIDNIKKRFSSEEEFKKELKRINLTEKEYEQLIKNKLIADKTILTILNINITDEDAQKYYSSNPEQFKIPAALKLRQIFVLTEKEAQDLIFALEAGADFLKLASLKNSDENLKKSSGDLGYITKGMLVPEIEKEVFSTPKGKYTKPLKTGNGYSIIMVEDIREEKIIPFEDVKNIIKNSIINNIINSNRKNVIEDLKKSANIEIK
ncbi:MAG: peptidyl-prolyl cis-trans isomerase [Elusimicrobiales bacterium]|nr:peptidyl-prolyl cis-trans isomerase [Elusimicrobiales bacterium]